MSVTPTTAPIGGLPSPLVIAKQADADLDRLLATVLKARCSMQAELRLPPKKQRRMAIQRRLLVALETYALALSTRGLLAPPKLRDELALQRGLAAGAPR